MFHHPSKKLFTFILDHDHAIPTLNRHFPFGFRLEPIQARNVSYANNLRLPHVDSSSCLLSAAPISGFLHLEHAPVSPLDGVYAGGA